MKVLSIKQPWATLILKGYKRYEFRSWKTKHRGELYIHASLTVDTKAMKHFQNLELSYPLGCIIGKVDLEDCIEVTPDFEDKLIFENPQVYGFTKNRTGYAWQISKQKEIEPIYVKGKLGIWEYKK